MTRLALSSALLASALALSAPARASDFSFVGNFATGNDVQLFKFSVGALSEVTLRTWSYAGGVNAAGNTIARGGFDPILALFDSTGLLIDQNDDGETWEVAPDTNGNYYDTYLKTTLAPGDYTVSVMAYSNFALGPNLSDSFRHTGSLNDRETHWAFDVLNVNAAEAPGAVPEPATWAMMLVGFGFVGAAMRSVRRRTRRVNFAF